MSKISNQSAYPAATPVSGDYLIGTDVSDSNATKTFTVGSIAALAPADTLSEVLTAGNTATNNILLTGDITCTNIIPTNIKDNNGNTGTAGQHLVKSAANALEWGTGTADTLQNVLTAGNTATNDINLTGNVILTGTGSIVMSGGITAATGNVSAVGYQASSFFQGPLLNATNIQDNAGDIGIAGQYLRKSGANTLAWETVGANTLSEVLTAGNTATNNIILTGNVTCTNLTATADVNGSVFNATTSVTTPLMDATDIQDNASLNGTAGQYLRKSAANALTWETVADPTLSSVLTAGNTATNNITLTGDISCTNITINTQSQAQRYIATDYVQGSYLEGTAGTPLKVPGIDSYADNAAAVAGGLAVGDVYMTDGTAAAPLNVAGILMVRQ
jgi:hypothetical protein